MSLLYLKIADFRDAQGQNNWYEPISIIEHKGTLSQDGISAGHYICDVKEKNSKKWYRTDDKKFPVLITPDEVSRQAYAVLYRKINE